jgi:hypothetical protein
MTLTCCGTAASWAADALPPTVCTRLRSLFGLETLPDTLTDAVAATDGPEPAGDLEVGEWATGAGGDHEFDADGETHSFPTFADALAVATLTDDPTRIRTVDPVSGEPLAVRVDEDGRIDADGTDASILTLGVGPGSWGGDEQTTEDVRSGLSPYVHAFAGHRTAQRWVGRSEDPVAELDPEAADRLGRLLVATPRDPAADVIGWEVPPQTAVIGSGHGHAGGATSGARTAVRRADD